MAPRVMIRRVIIVMIAGVMIGIVMTASQEGTAVTVRQLMVTQL